MKRKLRSNYKITLIGSLVIFICALSYGIFFIIHNPGAKEEKVVLYRCTHQTDVGYTVGLKPNNIYDSPSLNEGQVFIAPLVDKINTSFKYQFKGERVATIKGDYEIVGVIEGSQGEKDTYKSIWTKKYVLQAKTPFNAKNNVLTISSQIPIDFNVYSSFVSNLAKDLNFSFNSKLTVTMNVHIQATTDQGILEETLSPGLVIPLNSSFFEITKIQNGEKAGTIQRTDKIKSPVNWNMVIACGIALTILLIALLYLVLFTKGTASQDPSKKRILEIFKKYGNRMVALGTGVPDSAERKYPVNSIDDLVKLSDETGRPILYEHQENVQNITQFYIEDQTIRYYWKTKVDRSNTEIRKF